MMMVREGFPEKVTVKPTPEGAEGAVGESSVAMGTACVKALCLEPSARAERQ